MTLYQIISTLKQIALTQPNVKSATDGSVYDVMNANPSVKYNVVHFSQTTHQSDEEFDYYGLNIFYISRLEDSLEDNRLQIQSIAKEVLDNIIRTFCENWGIEFPSITYIPFTQKFADLCAGQYCTVRIEVPRELICADDYIGEVIPSDKNIRLQDLSVTITENGLRVFTPAAGYDGIGQVTINIEVPQSSAVMEDKEYEVTDNGGYIIRPSSGFDGMTSVFLSVDVPQSSGGTYEEGYEDGVADQKAKLSSTSFTQNSAYTRADGWSSVTVNVDDRYDEGYADGYGDGEDAQKGRLIETAITGNGIYHREDGFSVVEVNVPVSNDLIANLQGDYFVIPYGTTHLRDYVFMYCCFSSITIPTTVSAIGEGAFYFNNCLQEITLPDSVTSIGNSCFRDDAVLTSITLSNSITTIPAQCFYYSSALPNITIPGNVTNIGSNAFTECSGLTAMTFEGLVPPTLASTANSLGSTAYTFPIYVPCASVDAYKAAFGYSYAPRIQCIATDLATGITFNVPATIYGSATTSVSAEPSGAVTSIYYTSSDNTLATIDSNGNITVLASGTVTFCAIDARSGLEDCKTVNVFESEPLALEFVYITSTQNETAILYNGILTGLNETNTQLYTDWIESLSAMEVDGVVVSPSSSYTFTTPGRHIVRLFTDKTYIPEQVFANVLKSGDIGYWLTEAHLPAGLEAICSNAFSNTTSLTAVTLPETLKYFGSGPFTNTGIKSIVLPDSLTNNSFPYSDPYFSWYWFEDCQELSSVTIGSGITYLPNEAFLGCSSLTSITIPNNVTKVGEECFKNCTSLSSVIMNGVKRIGQYCFSACTSLTSLSMPIVEYINRMAFYKTGLETLSIPDSAIELGDGIISNSRSLSSVTIGSGITKLGGHCLVTTGNATPVITITATIPPEMGYNALGYNLGQPIYVPAESVDAYKAVDDGLYKDRIRAI